LTAFAQLVTHKLNCQRAFIGIIDHKTHHVIAEATKSISLQHEDQHAEGDALYCGLQALPIHWGICPSTIHVFSDPNSEYAINTENITANMSCYIIRDLLLEDAYKRRPYVVEWPYMRFYAEVPVKSPAGFVIGSFAIIDDKPRQIFTNADITIMQEISIVITQHLETVRLQHDSKHAGRLMQGLSSFVKDESSAKGLTPTPSTTHRSDETQPPPSKLRRNAKTPNAFRSEHVPNSVFSRASGLIRQSMDLEGVVFFDARRSVCSSHSNQLVCENLGFSTKSDSIVTEALGMPQDLLQQISARYSTGEIFNFDELGLVTVDHDEAASNATPSRSTPETDAALLSATFPGAHSIIFFPLPGAGDRWYAGCFGWTFDAKRALQSEEITYFAAFSNSIMSEIFRLEAVAMDRAKSDFISSISHELRSPLHGILASAELLQACSSGPDQDSLIHMVDTCGRTLLDTMNHLFDYAKITNTSRTSSGSSKDSSLPMSARSTLDLSELVEEVVEAVYTGHKHARASSIASPNTNGLHSARQSVAVILDIAGASDWVFKSEAGAWRRIVMNLFGNALKYTETGIIRVSLRADRLQSRSDGSQLSMVEFRIIDTGKGISSDYLKNRLYTPFAQEDSLSVGTGLGLSIVRQIVTALGGNMDIQSEPGDGTTVTVLIPLEASGGPGDDPDLQTRRIAQELKSRNITYTILQLEGTSSVMTEPSTQCLVETLSNWFGLTRTSMSPNNMPMLVIADEMFVQKLSCHDEFESIDHRIGPDPDVAMANTLLRSNPLPTLILGASSSVQLRSTCKRSRRLSQPFGPHKLANAMAESLGLNVTVEAAQATNGEAPRRGSLKRSYSTMSSSMSPYRIMESPGSFLAAPCTPESRKTNGVVDNPSLSILLVDDNDINLKIMSTYMKKLACRYVTASNGLEAVEHFQDAFRAGHPFEVVLMDVSMPVMDGFEATREIRAFERRAKFPTPARIIALTGLTSGKSQEEALASGADLFLTKPVQLRKLKGVLGLG
jgi:signal transduction histidine kinase/CheY-like chemotaxis protein